MSLLHTQEFLQTKTLDDLAEELAIKITRHETEPLVILNYNQIDSPKMHPIVRECRGLVLHSETGALVAKSFNRFFNWGEVADEMPLFDFSDFIVQDKEDGSLILLYYFEGQWRANTRGSFASLPMPWQEFTWQDGICQSLGLNSFQELDRHLNPDLTYVAEFCSPWNKVVRRYTEPAVYLLSAFDGHRELTWQEVDDLDHWHQIMQRPTRHHFTSVEEIQQYLRLQEREDPTYEGVVIRDAQNHRWKIKSATYLGLHRLRGEGDNLWNPKHLLPFILAGEDSELLTYFPEVKETFFEMKSKVEGSYSQLRDVWQQFHQIEDQKEFALAVKDATPFAGLLFTLRKNIGENQTEADLREIWQNAGSMILKCLYRR